jgi:4'-phosphopantetheinyl transferase
MGASGGMAPRIVVQPLDGPPGAIPSLVATLDAVERARAAAFRHPRDRHRFIARRAWLRGLLAEALACAPGEIEFGQNAFGKPIVQGGGDLRFSVSHSDGLGLCAIAHGVEIGCDVERRNPALADPAVARSLFARAEVRALEALPPEDWVEGFFNCWTRKEAFVKAIGQGLSYPLSIFEVSVRPGEPPALLCGGAGWSVQSFQPAPGYQAAVVTED